MGWAKPSLIVAGVMLSAVAVAAAAPQAEKPGKKQEGAAKSEERRVIVRPQIEIFQGGGARLGVTLRDVDEAAAKERKLATAEGALVEKVEVGSAAEKGGIKPGDVISAFDGERVRSVRQLQRLVTDTPPGRAVKVAVVREGRRAELTVTPEAGSEAATWSSREGTEFGLLGRGLDELRALPREFRFVVPGDQAPGDIVPRPKTPKSPAVPESPVRPRGRSPFFDYPLYRWSEGAGRLGAVVQELTPQLGEHFGAKDGVLVTSVSPDTPAERAGLKAGDVMTSVDGKPVTDVNGLVELIRAHPAGKEMSIEILRDRKPQTLKVMLLSPGRARPI